MKVTCKYETIDGQIFHDKYDAIKHEISLYPSFEIPAKMRHMCNNNFRLTWFNTPADANDSDDRVEWEGKGYYYIARFSNSDGCETVFKKFTTNMADIINEFVNEAIEIEKAKISTFESYDPTVGDDEESATDVDHDSSLTLHLSDFDDYEFEASDYEDEDEDDD